MALAALCASANFVSDDTVVNVTGGLVAGTLTDSSQVAVYRGIPYAAPQLREDNIDEVLAAMTLDEKSRLLVGTGMEAIGVSTLGSFAKLVPGATGTSIDLPRLGITPVVFCDGPAGARIQSHREYDSKTYYCTHFPIGTALASSWDTVLVKTVAAAIGNEMREYGIDVALAPGVNIQRNPLCGRNFEYYSEDPVLAGNMASAYIDGLQSRGVGATIKHFAFNNQETARLGTDARVSHRAARELYLKQFEIAVKKSQPWAVMSSYNLVNRVMTSERKDLLTTILRDEWGFKGLVVTDWLGGVDPVWRGSRTDRAANILAGNDLIEPGMREDAQAIREAVENGSLPESALDTCVRRMLQLVVKTPRFKGYAYSNAPDLKSHAALVRQSASECTVLLENNGVLPLASNIRNVALFGVASYEPKAGGTGSGDVNRAYTVSLVEGMCNNGYTVDEDVLSVYKVHIDAANAAIRQCPRQWWQRRELPKELVPDAKQLEAAVSGNDMAVITLQRLSGEGSDRPANDFYLTAEEDSLINNVCGAFHAAGKPVVAVLNIGGVIETRSWTSLPDAVLLPWQCGQEVGNVIADVLSGNSTPMGKLPMTWSVAYDDAPSSKNFPSDGIEINFQDRDLAKYQTVKNVGYTEYEEGIYVGYRYFDTFQKKVAYPFGYGLSYTTFAYDDITATDNGDEIEVSVTIKNTGDLAGKEIAQVYVTAPKGSIDKPAQELKAFAKTALLQPGESQTLTMTIAKIDLASFNEKESSWIADAGTYTFKVGASSRDIKGSAQLKLKKQTKQVNDVLK